MMFSSINVLQKIVKDIKKNEIKYVYLKVLKTLRKQFKSGVHKLIFNL